jgi:D-mannonate dehydratase
VDAHLPEDADQDEIDVMVERLRAQMETAAAQAGMTGVVSVRTEIREGRVWVVGAFTPRSDGKEPPT